MTFTRLIIDSAEAYLLPSLSRIYHNESVAVSGLPLMALTVSTKNIGAPAVVFVELIPIVCSTYKCVSIHSVIPHFDDFVSIAHLLLGFI